MDAFRAVDHFLLVCSATQELNFNSSHASAAAAAALPRRCCSIMAKRQRAGTDDELAK